MPAAACPFPPAGELLEIVRSGELPSAVADCMAAAAAELDPLKQAALLKASCYGRAFQALDPTVVPASAGEAVASCSSTGGGGGGGDARRGTVEVARRLRLLNALRQPGGQAKAGAAACSNMHEAHCSVLPYAAK